MDEDKKEFPKELLFSMVLNRHQKAISSKDLIGSSDHGNILKNNMF